MINNVKQGYVNPLSMMKNSRQTDHLNAGTGNTQEKKQKALENKKQAVQNSLLLMKGTSGSGETSEEAVKLLEKKLEEINSEIKTSRQEAAEGVQTGEEGGRYVESFPRKDTAALSAEGKLFSRSQSFDREAEEKELSEIEENAAMPEDF